MIGRKIHFGVPRSHTEENFILEGSSFERKKSSFWNMMITPGRKIHFGVSRSHSYEKYILGVTQSHLENENFILGRNAQSHIKRKTSFWSIKFIL